MSSSISDKSISEDTSQKILQNNATLMETLANENLAIPTLNPVTKLDSTGKTWTITGQVENRATSKKCTGYSILL